MTVRILTGDVRDMLATMPDESVHCVVTSPPYWGLRDYGVDGQFGMEPTMGEHIETMVDVFRQVRRVLRKDGTVWLNYGDCYAATTSTNGGYSDKSTLAGFTNPQTKGRVSNESGERRPIRSGLKPKDLCMIPNRLAIALQDDGWWIRSEIIWHKPNPMPESVTDRPATAHEKVWLLSKSARYWYDAEAVRTEALKHYTKMPDGWATYPGAHGTVHKDGRERGRKSDKQRSHGRRYTGFNERWRDQDGDTWTGANLRNVWTIPTSPFSEAHFATFPPKLAETCIKAGCPKGGTVFDPFGGSGTTGMVADRLGRDAILIELNPKYAEMARNRISADAGMFAEVT